MAGVLGVQQSAGQLATLARGACHLHPQAQQVPNRVSQQHLPDPAGARPLRSGAHPAATADTWTVSGCSSPSSAAAGADARCSCGAACTPGAAAGCCIIAACTTALAANEPRAAGGGWCGCRVGLGLGAAPAAAAAPVAGSAPAGPCWAANWSPPSPPCPGTGWTPITRCATGLRPTGESAAAGGRRLDQIHNQVRSTATSPAPLAAHGARVCKEQQGCGFKNK